MSFSLCLDYILFFDFVAVISIVTFQDLIRSAKEYEAYSDYLTTASYDELVAQIRNAGGVVNSEIRVKANPNGNGYYTESDISMDGLQEAIDNLEINTDKLDEILNSDEITNIDRDKPRMAFLKQKETWKKKLL